MLMSSGDGGCQNGPELLCEQEAEKESLTGGQNQSRLLLMLLVLSI